MRIQSLLILLPLALTTTLVGCNGDEPTDDTDVDTDTEPMDDSIADIQTGVIGLGEAAIVEDVVVTGLFDNGNGFFVQEPDGGDNTGIYVFGFGLNEKIADLAPGKLVDIEGVSAQYQGGGDSWSHPVSQLQPDGDNPAVTVLGDGTVPAPVALTVGDFADRSVVEKYEGMLVSVEDVTVTGSGRFGFFLSDDLEVNNRLYIFQDDLAVGETDTFTKVTGVVHWEGSWRILPRDAADFEGFVDNEVISPWEDVAVGDLVVTELMYDTNLDENSCEWFEVYNNSSDDIDLDGMVIKNARGDGSSEEEVSVDTTALLTAGSYGVIAKGTAADWDATDSTTACHELAKVFTPLAHWTGSMALRNGGDEYLDIGWDDEGTFVSLDKTATWPDIASGGESVQLDSSAVNVTDNDDVANWCVGTDDIGTSTDKGTPAAANNSCT